MKEYNWFLNQVVGVLSISLAMSCLGMENPKFFAWIAIVVVTGVVWGGYKRHLADQNEVNEIRGQGLRYFLQIDKIPYFLGMITLGLVATGFLNKGGLVFPPF